MKTTKYILKYALCAFLSLASVHLSASTMTLQSRSLDPRSITNDIATDGYRGTWNNLTSAITTQSLDAFDDLRVASQSTTAHVFSYFTADFSISADAALNDWGFRAGLDAGHGAALYLDGVEVDKNTSDLWWAYNWNNTSEILSITGVNLAVGDHKLELFWAESCCHGSADAEFMLNTGSWETLSTTELNTFAVPIPMAIWLFGSGVIAMVSVQRKQQSSNMHGIT
jgi:hypothetical protein